MKGTLAQELDFEHEGQNAERCSKELSKLGYVYVPEIYWDKCSKVNHHNMHLYIVHDIMLK